jgi:glycosyltransferase involved in cell wall biosynthesis
MTLGVVESRLESAIYSGGQAPKFSQLFLLTIERSFISQGKSFEALWLIQKYDLLNRISSASMAKLARQFRRDGYFTLSGEILSKLQDREDSGLFKDELVDLQKQIDMMGSKITFSIPRTSIKPIRGRVLHVVKQTILEKQAGYTIRTHKIARAQVRLGLDVHVVSQFGVSSNANTNVLDGVTYHSLFSPGCHPVQVHNSDWFVRNTTELARLVKQLRPEYLHAASDFSNAASANLVGKAMGLKVIYEIRGFWEETFMAGFTERHRKNFELIKKCGIELIPDVYSLRMQSEARWARESDYVLTLSATMQTRIESFGVPAQRISLVPNGVDTEEFLPLTRDDTLVARLGLTREHVIIGYISSLSAYEGVGLLIEAVASLKRESADVKIALVIVGGGKELENLRRLAKETGLKDLIVIGQVPNSEVADYYSIIDIFVVPRLPYEVCHLVTPLKPYEAMAMSKALVMSDVRALSSLAAESKSAITFEAGNPLSLKEALGKLVQDPKLRRKLGQDASLWVREHRTWDHVAKVTERVYQELRGAH